MSPTCDTSAPTVIEASPSSGGGSDDGWGRAASIPPPPCASASGTTTRPITDPAKCSYDACAVVAADFAADRWVNLRDVPAGHFAVASFRGTAATIEAAWQRLFARWLPDSGYQPDDRAGLGLYRGAPEAASRRGRGVFRCELCLPVRVL